MVKESIAELKRAADDIVEKAAKELEGVVDYLRNSLSEIMDQFFFQYEKVFIRSMEKVIYSICLVICMLVLSITFTIMIKQGISRTIRAELVALVFCIIMIVVVRWSPLVVTFVNPVEPDDSVEIERMWGEFLSENDPGNAYSKCLDTQLRFIRMGYFRGQNMQGENSRFNVGSRLDALRLTSKVLIQL